MATLTIDVQNRLHGRYGYLTFDHHVSSLSGKFSDDWRSDNIVYNCCANRHVRGENTGVRCGREGHNVDACYATSSRWGDDLDDSSDEDY
jgi:hypothetical protein